MRPEDMTVCALEAHEMPELKEFLGRVFKNADGAFLDDDLLAWKYVQERSDRQDPRSWVLRDEENRIVAHIGLVFLTFALPTGTQRTWHGIDWASTVPKAGRVLSAAVRERLSKNFRFGIGGTESARAAIQQDGMRVIGSSDTFAISLRPWKQLRTSRPILRPKRAVAFTRNAKHLRLHKPRHAVGWHAERLQSFAGASEFVNVRRDDVTQTERTPEVLDYLLACPANCSGYTLSRGVDAMGYVLFSHMWGQTRIAELRIASGRDDDWENAYALAIELAGSDPRTCEVVATGSSNTTRGAMLANALRPMHKRPLWVADPSPFAEGIPPFEIQAADSDAFFIGDRQHAYML